MADAPELDLSAAALLVLDFQNDFFEPDGYLGRIGVPRLEDTAREAVVERAAELIAQFKVAGRPVIWAPTVLRHDYIDCALPFRTMRALRLPCDDECLVDGTKGAEFVPGLVPDEGELLVPKKGGSAFQFTPLDRLLANLGVTTCVAISPGLLDGLADTVRHGGAFGYDMVVVPDACGYAPASPHLRTLEKRATFATSDQVIAALPRSGPIEGRARQMALVVVDMQNDYIHPDGAQYRLGHNEHLPEDARQAIVANTQRLANAMRSAGNPVVFVVTERRHDPLDNASPPAALRTPPVPYGNDYLRIGTWGAQVVDGLDVCPEDFVERKKGRSGFGTSPLHRLLRNLGVTHCVLAGGALHGCLEDTLREGASLGYNFAVAIDAIYPGPPSDGSRQVLGSHTVFKTTDELIAEVRQPATS